MLERAPGKRHPKKSEAKTRGVVERKATPQGVKTRDHDGPSWLMVLASNHGHGARSKDLTSRRGTLRWKVSWFAHSGALHGSRSMQAWPHDPIRTLRREGKPNRQASRDVKATGIPIGLFASNQRRRTIFDQVGRTHRSGLGVVKRWVPRSRRFRPVRCREVEASRTGRRSRREQSSTGARD